MAENETELWFGKREGWLGFGPLNWKGRSTSALYAFLVIVALVMYSKLTLTVLVVLFYTVVFGLLVLFKSNLAERLRPPEE